MADTTHSDSPPASQQPPSIAMQLLQLQTNSDSSATRLALSNITKQLQQLQTQYSEQELKLKRQMSALEAKVKFQASETSKFTSRLNSYVARMEAIASNMTKPPSSELTLKEEPGPNISYFQRLPDAIRQRIWRYTFPGPRIVQLFGTERVIGLAAKIPAAMHICHESRQVARSVYREINIKQIPCGIDFEQDTLYVSTAVRYYSPAGLLSDLGRWFELNDICSIAFQYELWKVMCDDKEAFSGFLEKLKGLQELIIVIDDMVPATPARRKRHVEFVHCGNSVREVIVGMVLSTLVDFGRNSLLSKIKYRKAVRQPVPTLPSKTVTGIDSKSVSNPTASPSGPAYSGLPGNESHLIQQRPQETSPSKQAPAPASSSGSSERENPTPQSEEGR
ncbi:hypothetical protein VE03_06143 [Pseudogymnoascus sp. 23342-1-I1]|nr:hypothetical protein VE03_06143 [Pseudogymnoascus sp. 23342-1-I1]